VKGVTKRRTRGRLLAWLGSTMLSGMTFAQRLAAALLVVLITIGALYAVMVAGGSAWFWNRGVRIAYDAGTLAVLVPWLAIAAVRPSWRPSSRLMPALLGCLVAFLVTSVTSRIPRMSAEMLGYAVMLAGLYLLLVAFMRRQALRRHFERLALALCVGVCSLYLVENVGQWLDWWGLVGRVAIPPLRPSYLGVSVGSPNPVATLVVSLGTFGLAALWRPGWLSRVAVGLVVVLVAVTTLISGSRGAWLGVAAAFVVVPVATVMTFPRTRARIGLLARSRAGALAIVVGIAVLGGGAFLAARSGRLTLDDGGLRPALAAASLRMFEASPLTGVGPNTWQILRAAFTASSNIDYYIPHAHDIYVMTLAEFGLLGVLAAIVAIANMGILLAHSLRALDPARRRVGLGTLFILVMLAGQQVADVLVNVPALLLAVALPIAWLDAADLPDMSRDVPATAPSRSSKAVGAFLPLGAAALICVIAGNLVLVENAAGTADEAVAAADAGSWRDATILAAKATSNDPGFNVYWFDLGIAAANAGDLQKAEATLARSATVDDYTYAWLDLAAVRWKLGDPAGSRQALSRAERLGWQRAPVAFAAGWLRLQLGDDDLATNDFAAALAAAPTLAGDPFWTSTPQLAQRWPALLSAAGARVGGDQQLQLDLAAGSLSDANRLAASFAASNPTLYDHIVPAWTGDVTALTQLVSLAERKPLDAQVVTWCQLIALHRGDAQLEQRLTSWANIQSASVVSVPRVVFGSPLPVPNSGDDLYGSIYRRPVPTDLVVSILPQLDWQTQA
jgi:O-antigen ligase/tetratricopeptide (TPR) repeat protein